MTDLKQFDLQEKAVVLDRSQKILTKISQQLNTVTKLTTHSAGLGAVSYLGGIVFSVPVLQVVGFAALATYLVADQVLTPRIHKKLMSENKKVIDVLDPKLSKEMSEVEHGYKKYRLSEKMVWAGAVATTVLVGAASSVVFGVKLPLLGALVLSVAAFAVGRHLQKKYGEKFRAFDNAPQVSNELHAQALQKLENDLGDGATPNGNNTVASVPKTPAVTKVKM